MNIEKYYIYDKLCNDLNVFLDKFIRKYIYDEYKRIYKSYEYIKDISLQTFQDKMIYDMNEYVLCNKYIKLNIDKFKKIYNIYYTTNYFIKDIIERVFLSLYNKNEQITIFYAGYINIHNDNNYNSIIKILDSIYI
jgi:hypothetical protein